MIKIALKVQTYSGYKADERPVSFTLLGKTFQVKEILNQWQGIDHANYKLLAEDLNIYVIRHDKEADEWELIMMEAPYQAKQADKG